MTELENLAVSPTIAANARHSRKRGARGSYVSPPRSQTALGRTRSASTSPSTSPMEEDGPASSSSSPVVVDLTPPSYLGPPRSGTISPTGERESSAEEDGDDGGSSSCVTPNLSLD